MLKRFLVILATITGVLVMAGDVSAQEAAQQTQQARAVFAGGCFWCMQPPFDKTEGVLKTTVGYTGGHVENPTYEQVSGGGTGHFEAIEIVYDPVRVRYEDLLKIFWRNIDPLDAEGQFCDRGDSYKSAIFYLDDAQKTAAEASAGQMKGALKAKVATQIVPSSVFYPAEDYHQSYYRKNPIRYKYYRHNCGRDKRLKAIWGG